MSGRRYDGLGGPPPHSLPAHERGFSRADGSRHPLPDQAGAFGPRDQFSPGPGYGSGHYMNPRQQRGDEGFAPRQAWAASGPSSSHQGHYPGHPLQGVQINRPSHSYIGMDPSTAGTSPPAAAAAPYHASPPYHPEASTSKLSSAAMHDLDPHHTRQVSRAACLSCRSAKRKCDGAKPICGPCTQRGIQDGTGTPDSACVYVASKRGGPRFKGVRGKEATSKVLNERERLRIEEEERSSREHDQHAGSPGQGAASPSATAARQGSHLHPAVSALATPKAQRSVVPARTPEKQASPASDLPSLHGRTSSETTGPVSPCTPMTPSSLRSDSGRDASTGRAQSPSVFAFGHQEEALCQGNYFRSTDASGGGLFDDLSFANLAIWQDLQGQDAQLSDPFATFYKQLQNLPKAGVLGAAEAADEPIIDDFDVRSANVDVTEAAKTAAAVNSEQQARALLSDYYELVYPGCPVMLPSGHLSSLAFHLSDDDSSALLAAISSCVALQLPQADVHRIVRGSMHLADPADKEANASLWALEHAPREEIARFHAKSAERLLLKKVAQLARGAEGPTDSKTAGQSGQATAARSSTFAPDLDLVRIKLIATHVLLAHYYYGATEQKRAFHHATQAWTHCQALHLDAVVVASATPSWFSSSQKAEWAKRAYWASYTAATVMSCTGGFVPLSAKRDGLADLAQLPGTGPERVSWKVLVMGAQFVSRSYATLYDLDMFRNDPTHLVARGQTQPRHHQQHWEAIFNKMQGIDNDIMNYTRRDPDWSDRSCFAVPVGASRRPALFDEENDARLQRSLRIAGKLMTSGALIILHRTQAFSNAKIFVTQTCGLPGACDDAEEEEANSSDPASDVSKSSTRADERGPACGRKHEHQLSADGDSDRAAKRIRTRPARRFSGSSHSSSSSDSGNGASTSDSAKALPSTKKVALTEYGIPTLFAGGPFDPSVSLERCRFAASIMYVELPSICGSTFRHGRRESLATLPIEGLDLDGARASSRDEWSAPSLPPYSACSLVLAAYVFLMETLHAQLAAGRVDPLDAETLERCRSLDYPFLLSAEPNRPRQIPAVQGKEALMLALRLRHGIAEIEHALQKFARAWDVAKTYVQEVNVLLEVNRTLFSSLTA